MGIALLMLVLMWLTILATGVIQWVFSMLGYIFVGIVFFIFTILFAISIYSIYKKISFKSAFDEAMLYIKNKRKKVEGERESGHACYHTSEDCENCIDALKCKQREKEYEFMMDGMK